MSNQSTRTTKSEKEPNVNLERLVSLDRDNMRDMEKKDLQAVVVTGINVLRDMVAKFAVDTDRATKEQLIESTNRLAATLKTAVTHLKKGRSKANNGENNFASPALAVQELKDYVMQLNKDKKLGKMSKDAQQGYELVAKGISTQLINASLIYLDNSFIDHEDKVQLCVTPTLQQYFHAMISELESKEEEDDKGNKKPAFLPSNFTHGQKNTLAAAMLLPKSTVVPAGDKRLALLAAESTQGYLNAFQDHLKLLNKERRAK